MATFTPEKKNNYEKLFSNCKINPERQREIDSIVGRMINNRSRYESVGKPLNIPWFFIAIIHAMEASSRFDTHLHNGDPLSNRTIQVPKGRPLYGTPPFTWEASASDALTFQKLHLWTDWSIGGILYKIESYNGFGYYSHSINSPYLWSYSNQYTRGKYVQDGHFDPTAVSKQCGAAALLRGLSQKGLVIITDASSSTVKEIEERTNIQQILALGPSTEYYSGTASENAKSLQTLLQKLNSDIVVDGKAGEKTSTAYFKICGAYLTGDPRSTTKQPNKTENNNPVHAHIVQQIIELGSKIKYFTGTASANAKGLQTLLNLLDEDIIVDGKAGEKTSTAYFKVSGHYLVGDPRKK